MLDMTKGTQAVRRMTENRAALLKDYPFFGSLLMRMPFGLAQCGTACTDGERLIIDPEFAVQLSDEELRFVMLHELLHCALHHCARGRGLHSGVYNLACDIVVNSVILQMYGLKSFHVDGEEVMHTAPDRKEGYRYSAEEVYEMLLKKHRNSSEELPCDHGIDRHDLWKEIQNPSRLQALWDGYLRESGRQWGDTAGLAPRLRQLVDGLRHRSQVDWRQVLHDFIQHDEYDYSFCPPDRRFLDSEFFPPAFNPNEDIGSAAELWLCIDASASVSSSELSLALREVEDAMRQAGLSGSVSYFDSEITPPERFTTLEEFHKIPVRGGGGTSFQVIFHYLQAHMVTSLPKAILIFTDGYAQFPPEETALGIPVLWIIYKNGNKNVPWGQVLQIP